MIDLYLELSPAAMKVPIMLEECDLPCTYHHIRVGFGDQHAEEFRRVSPNGKVPAIVDLAPIDGGDPVTLFESAAILVYLAEKSGRFYPRDNRKRWEASQWLFWQAAGLSPLSGQVAHFSIYAPEEAQPYGKFRYKREVYRHYRVLEERLSTRDFICDEYSIVDMATYTWVAMHKALGLSLEDYPHVARWKEEVASRPAVQRAYARAREEFGSVERPDQDTLRSSLFGAGYGDYVAGPTGSPP